MTSNPGKDLRSLGDRLFDKRDVPIATGTEALRPAANMIRANSFYFSTDTGVLWYSTGAAWTAASNAFGPKVHFATSGGLSGTANASAAGPAVTGLSAGSYAVIAGVDGYSQFGNGTTTVTVSPGGMVVSGGTTALLASYAKGSLVTVVGSSITSTIAIVPDPGFVTTLVSAWILAVTLS